MAFDGEVELVPEQIALNITTAGCVLQMQVISMPKKTEIVFTQMGLGKRQTQMDQVPKVGLKSIFLAVPIGHGPPKQAIMTPIKCL